MDSLPQSSPPDTIVIHLSRRALIWTAALLTLIILPAGLAGAGLAAYFFWSHLDLQSRSSQATLAHAELFAAQARTVESLLGAAELQRRELDQALTSAAAASSSQSIPLDRLQAEVSTLQAATDRIERAVADLATIGPRLQDQFRLGPNTSVISATDQLTLRSLQDRTAQLATAAERVPAQLAVAAARRETLIAQEKAETQRRAAQQRAVAQRAAAERAAQNQVRPAQTVVREVIVARPAPVVRVGLGAFGRSRFHDPFCGPRWVHPAYRHYPYTHCPRTGARVAVGFSFVSR